jgi:hypothetical protein
LVAGGETRAVALGVGKTVFNSANAAFIGSSVSPVVADTASGAVWNGWGAAQRDFFIIGPDGSLLHKVNLTPGFNQAAIDAIVQGALAALGGSSCAEDLDGDGLVNVNDLLSLLSGFGGSDASSDVNGDGVVDVNDLLQLLSAFGSTDCAGAGGGGAAAAPCAYGEECGNQNLVECGTMCPATCGTMPGMMCNMMCAPFLRCNLKFNLRNLLTYKHHDAISTQVLQRIPVHWRPVLVSRFEQLLQHDLICHSLHRRI